MLKAIKKNRSLRIADEKAKEYEKLGYTIQDMSGNMISEPENPAKQVQVLAEENAKLQIENTELKAKLEEAAAYVENSDKEIAELKAKLEEVTAYAEKADKEIAELKAKKTMAKKTTAKTE